MILTASSGSFLERELRCVEVLLRAAHRAGLDLEASQVEREPLGKPGRVAMGK